MQNGVIQMKQNNDIVTESTNTKFISLVQQSSRILNSNTPQTPIAKETNTSNKTNNTSRKK